MTHKRHEDLVRVEQIVVGHANPDFDAYAAMVAATKVFAGSKAVFLGTQSANVREFHNLHQDFLEFVDLRVLDLSAVRRLIMVDTRDAGRIDLLGSLVGRPEVEVIVFDHHPPSPSDVTGVDDRSRQTGASTSILVHEIRDRGIPITPLEASVMLLGIHEDTGSLTFPGSTAYDGEAAAFLMAQGADIEVLNHFLVRTLSEGQRGLLGRLVDSMHVWRIHGQDIAVGSARLEQYVDSASVVTHYLAEDLGYRVVLAVVEMPDRLYVVGRSRIAEVDIARVLRHLGGGGHAQAASASPRGMSVGETLEALRAALETEVRPPLKAGDIASRPVRIVDPEVTMAEAAELMVRWGHGGLPVVDDGAIVGVVTRKDVDKAVRHGLDHAPVKGFMGRSPVTVPPDAPLHELERLLASEGIGRLPVVSKDRVIGIVTRKDLLRAEHGDAYLDRRVPVAENAATRRFLESMDRVLPRELKDAVQLLGTIAEESGLRAHIVGGFVRDMLLGRENLDVDVVVEGDGVAFAEEAARRLGVRMKAHRRFGTAVLVLSKTLHIDIASARTEYYTRPGALPTVESSSLRQDLLRRDFSINAMAACIDPECYGAIADPYGGLRDLEAGIVRVLHSLSFVEDPTRVLRAVRFEQRYDFHMDSMTESLARQCVDMHLLHELSGARIREELLAILGEKPAFTVIARLAEVGALAEILPYDTNVSVVVERFPLYEAALAELEPLFEQPPRRTSALLVPLACGARANVAQRWSGRLRLGRDVVRGLVAWLEHGPETARMLGDTRDMRDSTLFELLDPLPAETIVALYATGEETARARIRRHVEQLARIRPAVTGDDLLAMGVEPGPAVSDILRQARDDRLDGTALGREAELANLVRLAARAGVLPSSAHP